MSKENKKLTFGKNIYGKSYQKGKKLARETIHDIDELFRNNFSVRQAALNIGHSPSAIQSIYEKLQKNQDVYEVHKKQVGSVLHTHPQNLDYICSLVLSYPFATLKELSQAYEDAFSTPISIKMMHYTVHNILHLKIKKASN